MTDLKQHLIRLMVFSRATYGPGARTAGVTDHIKKELDEVARDVAVERHPAPEWTDVVILALDGLTRSIWAGAGYNITADEVADIAVAHILRKQGTNERRTWPDWRTMSADKAIEHDRTGE